jgi:hypothetical protein
MLLRASGYTLESICVTETNAVLKKAATRAPNFDNKWIEESD